MSRWNKGWANSRRYLLLTSAPSEDGSYRLRSFLHPTQILHRHNWSAILARRTTTRSSCSSNEDYHMVFRRWLRIRGRTRLTTVLLAQPRLCREYNEAQIEGRRTLTFGTASLLASRMTFQPLKLTPLRTRSCAAGLCK